MYKIRGKPSEDGSEIEVDMDILGLSDESESAQGRVATHELDNESYVVHHMGKGPVSINYSGEYGYLKPDGTPNLAADAHLDRLKSLLGRPVSIFLDEGEIATGVLSSLNPSRQTRMGRTYLQTSWRCDITLDAR